MKLQKQKILEMSRRKKTNKNREVEQVDSELVVQWTIRQMVRVGFGAELSWTDLEMEHIHITSR